jgi:hypothetical protein
MSALTIITESDTRVVGMDSQLALNSDFRNLAEADLFGETWAARHNQEIWGTAPGGVNDNGPPPELARQRRAKRQP